MLKSTTSFFLFIYYFFGKVCFLLFTQLNLDGVLFSYSFFFFSSWALVLHYTTMCLLKELCGVKHCSYSHYLFVFVLFFLFFLHRIHLVVCHKDAIYKKLEKRWRYSHLNVYPIYVLCNNFWNNLKQSKRIIKNGYDLWIGC